MLGRFCKTHRRLVELRSEAAGWLTVSAHTAAVGGSSCWGFEPRERLREGKGSPFSAGVGGGTTAGVSEAATSSSEEAMTAGDFLGRALRRALGCTGGEEL